MWLWFAFLLWLGTLGTFSYDGRWFVMYLLWRIDYSIDFSSIGSFESQGYRERERQKFRAKKWERRREVEWNWLIPILWFTPQKATKTSTIPGQSQKLHLVYHMVQAHSSSSWIGNGAVTHELVPIWDDSNFT